MHDLYIKNLRLSWNPEFVADFKRYCNIIPPKYLIGTSLSILQGEDEMLEVIRHLLSPQHHNFTFCLISFEYLKRRHRHYSCFYPESQDEEMVQWENVHITQA